MVNAEVEYFRKPDHGDVCKRKAWEPLFNRRQRTDNALAAYQGGGKCFFENILGAAGGVAQKKQKLASELGCFRQEETHSTSKENYELSFDSEAEDILTNTVDLIEDGSASPSYPESNACTSECCSSIPLSSKSSSRSSISSRSPSVGPDCQTDGDNPPPYKLSATAIEHEIQHMSHSTIPGLQENKFPCFATQSSLGTRDITFEPQEESSLLKIDDKMAPVTVFDEKQPKGTSFNVDRGSSSSDVVDHSSRNTSMAPSETSHDATSSILDADLPSTEGDQSSQSKLSSEISHSSQIESAPRRSDEFESLVKDKIFRTKPEVGEYVYQALKRKLVCASPEDLPQAGKRSALSLLELLELQAFNRLPSASSIPGSPSSSTTGSSLGTDFSTSAAEQRGTTRNLPAIVTYGSSSSPSSSRSTFSTPGDDQAEDTNSSWGDIAGRRPTKQNDKASDPQNLPQKSNAKSSSQSNKCSQLRCPFNVIAPTVFCTNPDTASKYRVCAGPGWSNAQHLKEHLKSHHTKKEAKKPNSLQCSRCQQPFCNQEDLRSHDENVDCPITCPVCSQVFETKEIRQQHRKQAHPDDPKERIYMEITNAKWENIIDSLKSYTNSLKRGKGKGAIDPELQRWVEANRRRFESGRIAKAAANSKLDLGQWYIIFTMLRVETRMPEHPFYEQEQAITRGDVFGERVTLIGRVLMHAEIDKGNFPPNELEAQQAYYLGIFQDTVNMASQTKFYDHANGFDSPQDESLLAAFGPSTENQNAGYTMPAPEPQLAFGNQNLPGMSVPTPGYMTDAQARDGSMGMQIPDMSTGTSLNSEMGIQMPNMSSTVSLTSEMGMQIAEMSNTSSSNSIWLESDYAANSHLSMGFGQNLQDQYQDPGSAFSGSSYTGNWPDHQTN